ncbi:alcohol dehydrogenase [Entamoeba marina]
MSAPDEQTYIQRGLHWLRLPPKVFFEPYSIRYLCELKDLSKIFIVSDRVMYKLGYVERVMDVLKRRRNNVEVEIFVDVESEPTIKTIKEGLIVMDSFHPDNIIALGGGSVMDTAKIMWLFHENPELTINNIIGRFTDLRNNAFQNPSTGEKARLICIPTTSGTGCEVTPFALLVDGETGKKYPLADYSLIPSVAIIDPTLTYSLSKRGVASGGFEVLSNAIESYVSTMASSYTQGLCSEAITMMFEHFTASYNGDAIAREKNA